MYEQITLQMLEKILRKMEFLNEVNSYEKICSITDGNFTGTLVFTANSPDSVTDWLVLQRQHKACNRKTFHWRDLLLVS